VHLDPATHQLLARQHGAVSTRQLVELGYTTRQIRHLAGSGAIVPALRGSFRSPSVPFDELARCAAVCLAHPELAVAGPTAGRIWGLRRLPRDARIHVLAPPASHPSVASWVVAHRTAAVHARDIVQRTDGIRVTTRQRTALDLSRQLRNDDLLSVIEQAMHDGCLTEADMWAVAFDWISPGRPWIQRFAIQLERRLSGAAAESHPEVRVGLALQRAGVVGLVRQFDLELPRHGRVRFDLAVPDLSWAIEIDVHPRHAESAGRRADRRRDAAAARAGWLTSRISRSGYFDRFVDEIAALAHLHRDLRRQHSRAS